MLSIYWQVTGELGAAWLTGALIGAERSYHGRPAGFRTHALVCLASATAVAACTAPSFLPGMYPGGTPLLDPTRLVQGVMTGVGFLGAGVIFKEGVNVQGLTTAASVWATAAVGVLFGVGAFFPAALAAAAVIATLLVLRWVEALMPTKIYAWSVFRFRADDAPDRAGLHAMLTSFDVTLREVSYARLRDGAVLEFSGNLVTLRPHAFDDLAKHLNGMPPLLEFELSRISK